MITNLEEYFSDSYNLFLDEINYKKLNSPQNGAMLELKCNDQIEAKMDDTRNVSVWVRRTLKFDTDEVFFLKVSFGAILALNEKKKDEYDWTKIDLAREFKENGGFVTNNLMSRISLLIAQITATVGQQPLILPPNISGREIEE